MDSKFKFGIRSKIILGYIVIILCLLVSVILLNNQIRSLQQERNSIINYDSRIHELTSSIEKSVLDMETGQRGYIITGNQSYLIPYNDGKENWKEQFEELYQLLSNKPVQQQNLLEIKENILNWINTAGEPTIQYKAQNNTAALDEFFKEDNGRDYINEITEKFTNLRDTEKTASAKRATKLDQQNNALTVGLFGVLVLISLVAISLAGQTSKSIVRTIKEVTESIKTIAASKGNVSTRIHVRTNDEIRELAEVTNSLLDTVEQREWLQSNVADIVMKIQGIPSIESLASVFISEIAQKTNASFGAFYVKDTQQKKETYLKTATFAESGDTIARDTFQLGEGLIGQSAKEQRVLHYQEIPSDYRLIATGLGDVSPRSIIIVPVLFEGEAIAVLELATMTEFTALQQNLITGVVETFGLTINSIMGRMEIVRLLNESRAMTEELQVQSEELQTQSEELQSQSEELQMQKEELMATNEQLEDRTREAEAKTRDLEKAKEELEEKTELVIQNSNYKSEFLANMSHELRTPLNSILILSEMLAENESNHLSEEEMEFANVIHSSGKDLLSLINDILDLSKVEAGKLDVHFAEVSIHDITSQLERSFAPIANQKEVEFLVNKQEGLQDIVFTDEKRFQQIIKNLLSNAFKFTESGTVSLNIKKRNQISRSMRELSNDWLDISVTDTGIGIPKDKHKLIFETFQQADGATVRKYGGTGLGLSICREFARLLGGWISLKSEEGKGSTFTLIIPSLPNGIADTQLNISEMNVAATMEVKKQEARQEIDKEEQKQEEERKTEIVISKDENEDVFKGKKVLIVDDDNRNIFALKTTLEKRGMDVLVAYNGKECLDILDRTTDLDVILMDIMMPNMNGYETMTIIRQTLNLTEIPIIALTAKAMKNDREKCLEAGASDYISKPLDLDQLYSVLRVWLAK
ncbi:ATP-binding protein [Niallia sp. FSL R7-0648]|uniref:ATP-binding protein n=1 Tax=Niallia sp. FSL R7-0648 TaxID=2954521 RepID=UPI0030F83939